MITTKLHYITYADIFSRLALLMHSGININDGLSILAEEEPEAELAHILKDMAQLMDEGNSLSAALSSAGCFPAYATGMVQIAERVGRLEETLLSLSEYYENRSRMSQNIRNALTHPSILLLVMLVVIVTLLSKVLPIFDEVYASFGGSLSGLAGGLLLLGDFLSDALPYIGVLLGILVIFAAMVYLIPSAAATAKRLFLRFFGDRGSLRKANNAQFVQALSIALASGLSIEEGVELAANLFEDCPAAAHRCRVCQKLLDEGTDLVTALRKAELLSLSSCRMLSVAMRAGSTDVVIKQIALRMSDDAEDSLTRVVSRIEPVMVIITSVMVGIILLSVLLPLINIMKAIG